MPEKEERTALLSAIALELPKQAFDLLCVLALFPEIRVNLTLHALATLPLRGAVELGREEIFGALAALPWFRHGRMPSWLRLALVRCLDPAQRAEATRFYAAWLASGPGAGAQGGIEIVAGSGGVFAELRQQLRDRKAPPVLRDAIFLCFSRGKTLDDLDLEAPEEVAALLRPSWHNPRRASLLAAFGAALALVAAAWWAAPARQLAPDWFQTTGFMGSIACSMTAILVGHLTLLFRPAKAGNHRFLLSSLLLTTISWILSLFVPILLSPENQMELFVVTIVFPLASLGWSW